MGQKGHDLSNQKGPKINEKFLTHGKKNLKNI